MQLPYFVNFDYYLIAVKRIECYCSENDIIKDKNVYRSYL